MRKFFFLFLDSGAIAILFLRLSRSSESRLPCSVAASRKKKKACFFFFSFVLYSFEFVTNSADQMYVQYCYYISLLEADLLTVLFRKSLFPQARVQHNCNIKLSRDSAV